MTYAVREGLKCAAGVGIILGIVSAVVLCILQPFGAI